jgi:hypothetical protein
VDPTFGHNAWNIHFVLATNGVNPFKHTRSTWSTWPIVLLNYNLPPWLSTKKFFLMLCLLIPGKQSVTSECFDVYMEPLVEELLELWSGVPPFDITEEEGLHNFTLQAMLIWTIHESRLSWIQHSRQMCTLRLCWMSLVWRRTRCRTLYRIRQANIRRMP